MRRFEEQLAAGSCGGLADDRALLERVVGELWAKQNVPAAWWPPRGNHPKEQRARDEGTLSRNSLSLSLSLSISQRPCGVPVAHLWLNASEGWLRFLARGSRRHRGSISRRLGNAVTGRPLALGQRRGARRRTSSRCASAARHLERETAAPPRSPWSQPFCGAAWLPNGAARATVEAVPRKACNRRRPRGRWLRGGRRIRMRRATVEAVSGFDDFADQPDALRSPSSSAAPRSPTLACPFDDRLLGRSAATRTDAGWFHSSRQTDRR